MATKKATNSNLHNAKREKNDEFYTQLTDIEKELRHYKKHFRDKTVFCNCDDPEWSNFWQYFSLNFDRLQLRRLIATHYEIDKQSYMLEMWRDDSGVHTKINTLRQNGDFRSPESIALLQQADIVVTNPPFSLFREYVAQLMEYEKKFLIIGNKNAITYKEFFPLLKDNKAWIGYNAPCEFGRPDGTITKQVSGLTRWFTNLDIPKRHEPLIMVKRYDPELYPHYDNYDAINCDKVADIPMDYFESWGILHADYALLNKDEWEITRSDAERHWIIPAGGVLRDELREHADGYREHIEIALTNALYCNGEVGVPITILDSMSPDQHEIVGADFELARPMSEIAKPGDVYQKGGPAFYISEDDVASEERERERESTSDSTRELSFAAERIKYCSGVIGVPVTFYDVYCAEQWTIHSCHEPAIRLDTIRQLGRAEYTSRQIMHNGTLCQKTYHRLFIVRTI